MGRYVLSSRPLIRLGPVLFVHGGVPKPREVEEVGRWGVKARPPFFERGNGEGGVEGWVEEVREGGEL